MGDRNMAVRQRNEEWGIWIRQMHFWLLDISYYFTLTNIYIKLSVAVKKLHREKKMKMRIFYNIKIKLIDFLNKFR